MAFDIKQLLYAAFLGSFLLSVQVTASEVPSPLDGEFKLEKTGVFPPDLYNPKLMIMSSYSEGHLSALIVRHYVFSSLVPGGQKTWHYDDPRLYPCDNKGHCINHEHNWEWPQALQFIDNDHLRRDDLMQATDSSFYVRIK